MSVDTVRIMEVAMRSSCSMVRYFVRPIRPAVGKEPAQEALIHRCAIVRRESEEPHAMFVLCLCVGQDASSSARGRRPAIEQEGAPLKQSVNVRVYLSARIAKNVQATHFLLIVVRNLVPGILLAMVMDAALATAHACAVRDGLAQHAIHVVRGFLEVSATLYALMRSRVAATDTADRKAVASVIHPSVDTLAVRVQRLLDLLAVKYNVRRMILATAQDAASRMDHVYVFRLSIAEECATR